MYDNEQNVTLLLIGIEYPDIYLVFDTLVIVPLASIRVPHQIKHLL